MGHSVKRGARWAAVPGRALRDKAMTPKLREVLLSVCYYAHQDGRCVVKIETLAAPTGTDERNMRRYLATLQDLGYLEITNRSVGGMRRSSAYRVLHDAELPPERDRAATPETIMVDTDLVTDDAEDHASDDRPGSEHPGARVVSAPSARVVSARGKNTNPITPRSNPMDRSADAEPPVQAQDSSELVLLDAPTADPVSDVWTAFQATRREVMGNRYREQEFSSARRELIAGRIRERGLEMVLDAVRGWSHDEHYAGRNDTGEVWGRDIERVLRVSRTKGDNVERFAHLEADAREGTLPATPLSPKAAAAERRERLLAQARGESLQITAGGAA